MSQNANKNSYSSKNLDDIRKRIDTLDNSIHDMLMERAELVLKIGAEKRKNNIQIVQPAREARMIRRLLSRHKGVLPEMAVVRIWRELVGAVSLLQTGLKVAVAVEDEEHHLWDLAKDYFGSCLPFQKSGSTLSAIAAVRDGRATFAVVPWPCDSEDHPWWEQLREDGHKGPMRISIRLPHGDDPEKINPDHKGLVVSQTGFDSSDDDRSFLLVECDSTLSRGKVIELAKEAGFETRSIFTKRMALEFEPSLHFMEVDGYVDDENAQTHEFQGLLGTEAKVSAVGGYPVPPVYSKTIEAQDDPIPAKAS
ncbi:MAG: chorismate mutase [Pseudomonadota bacterium]